MDNDSKPADETQDLFDIKQAAEFLGVSVITLKRWRKSGKLVPDTKGSTGRGKRSKYSISQLKKVSNSRYEHSEKGIKFEEKGDTPQEKGIKFEEKGDTPQEKGAKFEEKGIKFEEKGIKFEENGVTTRETGITFGYSGVTSPEKGQSSNNDSKSRIQFIGEEEEKAFKETSLVVPETWFSPKDKVSNVTWNNELPLGDDIGVITVRDPTHFGCLVNLNYEEIINSEDIVTGAELSSFDRSTYDAVVTLCASNNFIFTTADLWRIISQNPDAKLTDYARKKIVKSMFHITKFWLTIITDHSDKIDVWHRIDSKGTFKPERKFYKALKAHYTGRLLDFQVIGYRSYNGTEQSPEENVAAEVWKILSSPILYEYAKAKGQIASSPIISLDTSKKDDQNFSVNRGYHNDELTHFLAREIDTMKKTATSRNPYNRIITLERIYSINGIDAVQQNNNNLNSKRKQTRDKVEKILSIFKDNSMIQGYLFHKKVFGKASTFYSVEILL